MKGIESHVKKFEFCLEESRDLLKKYKQEINLIIFAFLEVTFRDLP